jgi:hypothetical protein
MILHADGGRWYIDCRVTETSDQMSYDLTQHLVRRTTAGTVIVAADNSKVFLSVIKKRWAKLLYEVECMRSSTLDHTKRESLQYEVNHMRTCRFATKHPEVIKNARVYVLAPQQLDQPLPEYATLYITTLIDPSVLYATVRSLAAGGVIVIYGPWLPAYDVLLKQAFRFNG